MASKKVQVFIAVPDSKARESIYLTRLIKGTQGQVDSLLLNDWSIRPATAEDGHALRDVQIEDATGEPV